MCGKVLTVLTFITFIAMLFPMLFDAGFPDNCKHVGLAEGLAALAALAAPCKSTKVACLSYKYDLIQLPSFTYTTAAAAARAVATGAEHNNDRWFIKQLNRKCQFGTKQYFHNHHQHSLHRCCCPHHSSYSQSHIPLSNQSYLTTERSLEVVQLCIHYCRAGKQLQASKPHSTPETRLPKLDSSSVPTFKGTRHLQAKPSLPQCPEPQSSSG